MEEIKVDAKKYIALLELEHKVEADVWHSEKNTLKGEIEGLEERIKEQQHSMVHCNCEEFTLKGLIYVPKTFSCNEGDYYECPKCKKKWELQEMEG